MSDLEAIVFKSSSNHNLVGVMHPGIGQEPRPCLIACHGFVGTKYGGSRRFLVDFARYAVKHNLSVFRFDFSGCGDSEGDFVDLTIDSELEDLEAAIDVVSTIAGVDPQKIGVFGQCLGAVTAICAASRDSRIYKVVAWAPFVNFADALQKLVGEEAFQSLQLGEEAEFMYHEQPFRCSPKILNESLRLDMFEEITRVRKPLLVIHGTEDAVVPLQDITKLMDFAKGTLGEKELAVIEGAHHSFPYHQDELFKLTTDWFL
ncbi:alpha/beta hydrolase [Nostoc sp.]|uniref:alpha/beta hydrolase n=1 Tax=Nostoc sp. TaxID=1180 RepID=UPI002FF55D6D